MKGTEIYLKQLSQNQGRLYGFIHSLHSYENDIDDILQETNVTLLNKEADFDSTKDFLPWAFAIARFTLLNHKKKKAKEGKKIIYDTPLMDLTLQFKDSAKILYESEVERLKLLKTIKTQLPRKQLALLNLLLEGKTVKEIAAEWGDKPPTV